MKQEHMIGTRLPNARVKDLEQIEAIEQTDRSTTVRKLLANAIDQWKLDHYATQYGQGKLSMARAAREAGVSLWEFQTYARQHQVSAQYDREELDHDLKTVYARLRRG